MDYLDPQKRFRQTVLMFVGYALLAVAILGGTIVLLFLAYGFGLGKNGQVIQKGLIFVSSQPNPASIYLNGQLNSAVTNTKLLLPAGRYTLRLEVPGYRPWQRAISVLGGNVQHYDYPMLFPTKLTTNLLHSYGAAPSLASQSPDQHWLVVAQPGTEGAFDLYDLTNPAIAPQVLTLPANLYTKGTTEQGWQALAWADDNRHLLLQHNFDNRAEFIELDSQNVAQSVNLDSLLGTTPTAVSLDNQKYDHFYLYNAANHSLSTATLSAPTPVHYLSSVLAYKSYGSSTMLYVTDAGAPAGKVEVKMQVGTKSYPIRELTAGPTYLLNLASYNGPLYVVVGSSVENRLYIYQDPVGQAEADPGQPALPMRALRITAPDYLSFATTAQFVMAEHGQSVVMYNFLNGKSYSYSLSLPLDAPQSHAQWMDGDRLVYVSGGHLVVVDYDNANRQTLMPMLASYSPFFAPDFQHVYALAPSTAGAAGLTSTALVLP